MRHDHPRDHDQVEKSFITPFDCEDTYTLAVALDEICDYIDAGARAIVMYDIREYSAEAIQLARIIRDLGTTIKSAVTMLKKPDGINRHFVEIHRLENQDDVYFQAIGKLFKERLTPFE